MATVQILADHDCVVDESDPDANQDGNQLSVAVDAGGANRLRFYVKWSDLSVLPAGAAILSVRIGLKVLSAGKSGTFPLTINALRVSAADWDETTITWNNQPGGGGGVQYDQPDIGSNYLKWIESSAGLVQLVQNWLDTTWDNRGIEFILDNEAPGEATNVTYDDKEGGDAPILEVEYYTAETIPGADPGDDLDSYKAETHDRLDARDKLKAAHEVTWTINSTEHDVTGDLESIGDFRTRLPWILEDIQTGESVFIADNKDRKFSPHDRNSILWQQDYVGTEIKVRTGLELRPNDKDMVEQYVGQVDYLTRQVKSRRTSIKTRPNLSKLTSTLVSVSYATERQYDALYDLCINLLDLTTAGVNVKSFFDAKAAFPSAFQVTKTYTNEAGATAGKELAIAGQGSLYMDRRGRIAVHYWQALTATGNEITLSKDTNVASMQVRERDDLIVNKVVINWGAGLANQFVATDADSIARYGIRAHADLDLDLIIDEDVVIGVADAIFLMRAEPPIEARCITTIEALRIDAADQVLITEPSEGFDEKVFIVTERILKPGQSEGDLVCMAPQ